MATKPSGQLDLEEAPAIVAPVGILRMQRIGGILKYSIDGSAFAPLPDPGTLNALGADATTVTIPVSGAGGFEVYGEWVTTGAADKNLILQLNSINSGYNTPILFWNVSGITTNVTGDPGGGAVTNGVLIARAGGNSGRDRVKFRLTIHPSSGAYSAYVEGRAEPYASATGASQAVFLFSSVVLLAAAPITSLVFTTSDTASLAIKAGSAFFYRSIGMTG